MSNLRRQDLETGTWGVGTFPSKIKITDVNGQVIEFDNTDTIRIRQELTAIRIILSDAFKVNMTDKDVSKL